MASRYFLPASVAAYRVRRPMMESSSFVKSPGVRVATVDRRGRYHFSSRVPASQGAAVHTRPTADKVEGGSRVRTLGRKVRHPSRRRRRSGRA
ncbi:hypothetical protein PG999_007778 [Apiospora kogelbergensis]|uniref:Uncharacterized protein n=1 Tax=Apiospora kogelbergensis TaxID=1337665 RepID=A0AAW0QPF9_9PEZI